jgi:hypothetical protein
MRTLADADFLEIWENGARRHPLDRALLMLAAALPDTWYEDLADWPLGRRNQSLAQLRCRCFGDRLPCRAACRNCGEPLEFELDGSMLAGGRDEQSAAAPILVNERSFRLPTSRDLAKVAREADPAQAALQLAAHCLLPPAEVADWTVQEVEAIGEEMARADPMAEILVSAQCPECGEAAEETLDIASFLWDEIAARARRRLLEIHALASAYGWSEAEILALSEARRGLYFEAVQS